MTDKIEPALSAEEWEDLSGGKLDLYSAFVENAPKDTPRLIAALNHELPDSDPRKITREKIAAIRETLGVLVRLRDDASGPLKMQAAEFYQSLIVSIETSADALESYLPPETPNA